MKKHLLTLAAVVLLTITVHSQVGINNTAPKTTLDVTGVVTATVPDGVSVPRLTAAALEGKDAAYGVDQNGTLIFVISGIGSTPKTSDVTTPGFYYYDNPSSKWKGIGGSPAVLNVTPEQTGSYTVMPTDSYIKLNINTSGTILTLPTTGILPGKKIYVSNIGFESMDISPVPRNVGFDPNSPIPPYTQVKSGSSGVLIYIGGTGNGSWDWISGN